MDESERVNEIKYVEGRGGGGGFEFQPITHKRGKDNGKEILLVKDFKRENSKY